MQIMLSTMINIEKDNRYSEAMNKALDELERITVANDER